jgi:predicted PurR-regulated permease PerM
MSFYATNVCIAVFAVVLTFFVVLDWRGLWRRWREWRTRPRHTSVVKGEFGELYTTDGTCKCSICEMYWRGV